MHKGRRQRAKPLRLAICVPVIVLVISKTVRKRKYTISKTIIWAQSWICVEIQDLDIHICEIISKIMDVAVQVIDVESQIMDLDVQIADFDLQVKDLDVQIYDF